MLSASLELSEEFDLPVEPRSRSGARYDEARVLVRLAGEPLGFATVTLGEHALEISNVMAAVEEQLAGALARTLLNRQRPGWRRLADSAGELELDGRERCASIVVCTRNRAAQLGDCLSSLSELAEEALEFIVVDNAPRDESTRELVERLAGGDERWSYVREAEPGLSRARNRGLAAARGEIVAFTDDDVRVDPLWVKGLLRGFARAERVGCVTGLVASASLELAAEQYFDRRVWWSSRCEPEVYDATRGPSGAALHPYAAGGFGTGANFAFQRELLCELGGFDECLGAGSSCEGGEDLDIFVRCILAGHAIAYEPAALVWHEHRAGREELARQMYCYGKALSAFLAKYALSRATTLDVIRRMPQGLRHLGVLAGRSRVAGERSGLQYEPVLAETRGLLAGPLAYALARRRQDPARRRAVAP